MAFTIENPRFALISILSAATLTVMAGSIITPVLPLIRDELGIDPTSAGLIITTHALFVAFLSPIIGNLIDRIGTKKPFIFGLILYGLSGGSGLFISSYWTLIISRAILGVAVASIYIPITVMILNLYKESERNKIMGWRSSSNSFGGMLFPVIGGFLGTFSWHLPFGVYFLGIFLGIISFIAIPETYKRKLQNGTKEVSIIQVFRNNPILFIPYGLWFLAFIFLYTIVVFLPQFLTEIGIPNSFYIGLFIMAFATSVGLTALLYGKIKTRLSYKMIVLSAFGLWGLGFIGLSLSSSGLMILASVIPMGIGHGLISPAVNIWAGETVHFSFRGRVISYLTAFGYVGQFISPLIFGPVSLSMGFNGVFLIAGIICAPFFLLFLIFMKK